MIVNSITILKVDHITILVLIIMIVVILATLTKNLILKVDLIVPYPPPRLRVGVCGPANDAGPWSLVDGRWSISGVVWVVD